MAGTRIQMEALIREAWRLYGKSYMEAQGKSGKSFEDLENLSDDEVSIQLLWESVQSFIHADEEDSKDSFLIYQRVGKLEENVGALNLNIHAVAAFKTQLDEAAAAKRMERTEIREMVRSILRESLVDEPDDDYRY